MSRNKSLILSVVSMIVALALSAAGAATASAAFELDLELRCEGGTFINFCWASAETGALLELTGDEQAEALLDEGEAIFRFKSGTTTGEWTCKVTHTIFEVENHPLKEDYLILPLIFEFKECAPLGSLGTKCKIPAELNTNRILGAPETDEEIPLLTEEAVTFSPEGSFWIEIPISTVIGQTCVLNGVTFKVSGKQQCLWNEPLVDRLGHLLVCLISESLMKAAGNQLEFEAHFLILMPTLEKEDWWDIEED